MGLGGRVNRIEEGAGPERCEGRYCLRTATTERILHADGSEERIGQPPPPLCGACPERSNPQPHIRHVVVVLDRRGALPTAAPQREAPPAPALGEATPEPGEPAPVDDGLPDYLRRRMEREERAWQQTQQQTLAQQQLDYLHQQVDQHSNRYTPEEMEPLTEEQFDVLSDSDSAAMFEIQYLKMVVDRGAPESQRFVDEQLMAEMEKTSENITSIQVILIREGYSASWAEIREFIAMRTAPEE